MFARTQKEAPKIIYTSFKIGDIFFEKLKVTNGDLKYFKDLTFPDPSGDIIQ